MSGILITPWSEVAQPQEMLTDADRDAAFQAYTRALCHARFPWLLPILDAASAMVVARPGYFAFAFPLSEPKNPVLCEIPEISQLLISVPWFEPTAE